MTKLTLDAGVCGMITKLTMDTGDDGLAHLTFTSDCPHVTEALGNIPDGMDPYAECLIPVGETEIFKAMTPYIPHTACPSICAVVKCLEAEGQLALKKDVSMKFEE